MLCCAKYDGGAGDAHYSPRSPDAETIYHAYVVDLNHKLLGVVSLRELILADPEALIKDLMLTEVVSAKVDEDQEEVARIIARYDLLALPITDEDDTLLGIITYDDAMDVVTEEVEDDFHKSAAMGTVTGSFKDATIGLLYQNGCFGWCCWSLATYFPAQVLLILRTSSRPIWCWCSFCRFWLAAAATQARNPQP